MPPRVHIQNKMVNKMKRKLIVHVGMGKTGSTSIQRTLKMSSGLLADRGVKYLGLMLEESPLKVSYPWHFDFGWSEFTKMPVEQREPELITALTEIDETLPESIQTLIWSNESLFDGLDLIKNVLLAVAPRFEIEIVGYVRSPGNWIQSAYMQWGIKHKTYAGTLKPFDAWAANHPYRVKPLIDGWSSLGFRTIFFNFDVILDVAAQFINAYIPGGTGSIKVLRSNDTPAPIALAMFAYHNSLSEDPVHPAEMEPLLNSAGLLQRRQNMPEFNELLPTNDSVIDYLKRFEDEVSSVNAYFDSVGQPPFESQSIKVKDVSVDQNEINRALLELVVYLEKQIKVLREEIASVKAV